MLQKLLLCDIKFKPFFLILIPESYLKDYFLDQANQSLIFRSCKPTMSLFQTLTCSYPQSISHFISLISILVF